MEENKFWLHINQMGAGLAVVAILTLGTCTAYESKLASDMVKGGTNPVAARCAVSIGTSTACLLSSHKP